MNLKHFYYRGYFDGRIKLTQPQKGSEERKKNQEVNEKAFRLKNATLVSTSRVRPFSTDHLTKIAGLETVPLVVQNPGLLPGIGYPHEVGYEGELKLGFGFDHVSGLPVLPGSSVKGVLRSVFPGVDYDEENPRLFKKRPDGTRLQPDAKQKVKARFILRLLEALGLAVPDAMKADGGVLLAHALELSIFEGWDTSGFFSGVSAAARRPMHLHDVFFDAQPRQFGANALLGRDALTPHTAGALKNPIPLPFLKVMPGVVFAFPFRLHTTTIGDLELRPEHKRRLFAEILCTVGAGAKTNVGYGQFEAENAGDRIRAAAEQAGRGQPPIAPAAPAGGAQPRQPAVDPATPSEVAPPRATRALKFDRNLKGKKVVGEVVAVENGMVHFRLVDVEGFDGTVEEEIREGVLPRFTPGKRFEMEVRAIIPDQNKIVARVTSFTPLN
ncbi:MAG: type III-B CRISPR module RAMP protein Cmr6 [Saprospiraceae bacterium]